MTETTVIYLDHAASTPCDPRVVDAMLPYFTESFANPSSLSHAPGRAVRAAVEDARERVADLLHAASKEIIFTSGATESNNLAIKGTARAWSERHGGRRGHVITTAFEHPAVLNPCRRLEREGFSVSFVAPRSDGVVDVSCIEPALRDDTILVSVIWANNEIGTLSDVPAIGALCRERGIVMHTDATQLVGLEAVDVRGDAFDLLSLSGHKIHGPKGVGALYLRDSGTPVTLQPIIEGGSHERTLRAGTLNAPGIVGLGRACALCGEEMGDGARRLRELRRRLEAGLAQHAGPCVVNGSADRRAAHISNVVFAAVAGCRLLDAVEGLACSSGSAVSSGTATASHVLRAIGVPDDLAVTSLRLSLGRTTTEAEIDAAVQCVAAAVERVRTRV